MPSGTDELADFTVVVKKVQELVLPELDDAWVQENRRLRVRRGVRGGPA